MVNADQSPSLSHSYWHMHNDTSYLAHDEENKDEPEYEGDQPLWRWNEDGDGDGDGDEGEDDNDTTTPRMTPSFSSPDISISTGTIAADRGRASVTAFTFARRPDASLDESSSPSPRLSSLTPSIEGPRAAGPAWATASSAGADLGNDSFWQSAFSSSTATTSMRQQRQRLRSVRQEAFRIANERERDAQRVVSGEGYWLLPPSYALLPRLTLPVAPRLPNQMIDAQRETIRAGDRLIDALRGESGAFAYLLAARGGSGRR